MKFLSNVIKKITIVLSIVAMLSVSLFSNTVFGADFYYRIINGDSQQSALVLAELGDVDVSMDASSNIKIFRCINGVVDAFSTKLNKIDNSNNEYSAGDKVLVSVSKRFFGGYDVALFMKEVTVSEKGVVVFSSEEYTPDLFSLEWYVNTGEKDFIFEGDDSDTVEKVYVNDSDVTDVNKVKKTLIYSEDKDGNIDVKRLKEPILSHENNVLINEKFYYKYRILLIVICFIVLIALVALRVWFDFYMKKRKRTNNSITDQ